MRTRIECVLTILAVLTLVGCANARVSSGVGSMMNAVDGINRSAFAEPEKSMILVTMTEETHAMLLGEGTIDQDPLPVRYEAFLNELTIRYRLRRVADWPLSSLGIRCLVFESQGLLPREQIIAELAKDPRVETTQPLQLFRTLATTYDDPYSELQHGLQSMQVKLSHRWVTGRDVNVAVIDTGVDITHPELRDHIAGSRNFVDLDEKAFVADVHGTAVTAVIAASANNGVGMVGVAPDSRILALKACWQESSGYADAVCTSFTLAKAINFAVEKNVDVINLSLGGPQDPLLERLVRNAIEKKILVVGATEADRNNDFPTYIAGVIPVSEARASHRGKGHSSHLKAPGRKVLSARPGGDYDFFSGSSLAAAHVSGLVALLCEYKPRMRAEKVLTLLQATSKKTRKDKSAIPVVNACLAITKLNGGGSCAD